MANRQGTAGSGPRQRTTTTTTAATPAPLPLLPPPLSSSDRQTSRQSSFGTATQGRRALAQLAWSEARAKFVWGLVSIFVRIAFGLLLALASYGGDGKADGALEAGSTSDDGQGLLDVLDVILPRHIAERAIFLLSSVASAVIIVLPSQLFDPKRPGIIFGSPALLHYIRNDFRTDEQKIGPMPNVPFRIAECAMGRLSYRQLAVILPVHFVVTLVVVALVQFVLPMGVLCGGLDPIPYVEGGLWLSSFLREVLVNAALVVGLRVLPELMKLNRVSNVGLWTALVLCPLCCVGVDSSGVGSSFAPDVVYALRCVDQWVGGEDDGTATTRLGRSAHRLGPVLGGWVGGRIMAYYFPDEHGVV